MVGKAVFRRYHTRSHMYSESLPVFITMEQGPDPPAASVSPELRMVFTFLNVWK